MPRKKMKPDVKHEPYTKLLGKMQEMRAKQKEVAQAVHLSVAGFNLKLNGKLDFSIQEAESICRYLHCNPSVFFRNDVCGYRNSVDIMWEGVSE